MQIVTRPLAAVLVFAVVVATSCGNDADFDLTGQWEYAYWQMGERQVDLATLGTPIIDFNNDGTFKASLNGKESNEKWLLEGDTLSLIYSDGNNQKFYVNVIKPDSIDLHGSLRDTHTKLTLIKTKH